MTKEGKLDVSFLRVDKTKKQIHKFENKQCIWKKKLICYLVSYNEIVQICHCCKKSFQSRR